MSTLGIYNGAALGISGSNLVLSPLASVEVRREDTAALASIYSDRAGSVGLSNPMTADAYGRFAFYAAGLADGYRIRVTEAASPGLEYTLRYQRVGTLGELDNPITTKGDLLIGGAGALLARKAVGANGAILMARSADSQGLAYVAALKSAIYGFTWQPAAGSPTDTNAVDIAAGGAMDSTAAYWITGAALTKKLNTAWAVGDNAGMLDTGAVGNSDYYLWAIARSDTGVVDYLASLSSTAPTMPSSYDFKRLIGWVKRVAGVIVAFHTYETNGGGVEFSWDVPTLDINLANTLTTSRRTDAVKVPLNFSTIAHLNVFVTDVSSPAIWVCSPDQTDAAPSISVAPLSNIFSAAAAGGAGVQLNIRTSAAGLIAARANVATVDTYCVSTLGFRWARRT